MMTATFISVAVGLTIGNFVWEAHHQRAWEHAIEKSYYQWLAIAMVALFYYLKN
jgi:hypothetical protein